MNQLRSTSTPNLHCQGNETTFDPRSVLESNSHHFMAARCRHAEADAEWLRDFKHGGGKRRAGFSVASAVRGVCQRGGMSE